MRIIPVIDLQQGQVVHAVAGQRDRYRPLRSQLCPDNDPCNIVQAFLGLYPFKTVYIADLAAISGGRPNTNSVRRLLDHFPRLDFWLDQGLRDKNAVLDTNHKRIFHVIGSETGISPAQCSALLDLRPQPLLSLDFSEGNFLGDITLLQRPDSWPENIILMNLDRVGTASGIDKNLLARIQKNAIHSHIFVAGGIRNFPDIQHLRAAGVAGALVATALHTGQITFADLLEMDRGNTKKMPR
ncbi:MAG: HisA/HisF-related TIM barrel protein [Gammaproteobacteria bacterium]